MLTVGVIAAVGTIAYIFAFCWLAGAGPLLAPVMVGVGAGLVLVRSRDAALAAGIASTAGSFIAVTAFRADFVLRVLENMPAYANPDVPRLLYQMVYEYALTHPVTTWGRFSPLLILLGASATTAVAYGSARLLAKLRAHRRRWVEWGVVAILCGTFIYSSIAISAPFIDHVNQEPQPGAYAFDGSVYVKTFYNMQHGQDYYAALVDAAAGDSRLMKENWVRGGKFYGWFSSPGFVRIPITFYAWQAVSFAGAGGVVYLAALAGALVLAAVYWGARARVGSRALFVVLLIFPYLLFMGLSFNIFFNDYWAALAALASVAVLLRRQWVAAAVLACLAAVCRDVLLIWLLILIGVSCFTWLRKRGLEWGRRAAVSSGMLLAFGGAYAWNYANAARIVVTSDFRGPLGRVLDMAGYDLVYKLVQPTSYMMFPYGYFVLPGLVLWLVGPLGLWAVTRNDRPTRYALVAWSAYWIAFYVILGVSSSYWGQHTLPVSLMGLGLLLCTLDQLGPRLELRGDPPPSS